MGRFWLGICLLAAFLVLGLWVTYSMDTLHQPISQTLEEAAAQSLAGDLDAGIAQAQQARRAWDSHWHGSASVADHAPMDEIDGLFAQMEVYAQAGRSVDFAAYCARLSQLISAMGEAHSPGWWNVL